MTCWDPWQCESGLFTMQFKNLSSPKIVTDNVILQNW